MAMYTTVRFKDIVSVCTTGELISGMPEQLAGKEIRILLPPKVPNQLWSCNPEFIWQVHPDDVVKVAPNHPHLGFPLHVCEHMVDLD